MNLEIGTKLLGFWLVFRPTNVRTWTLSKDISLTTASIVV